MAQLKVEDLKIDYSRDYQPVTTGPGGGFFTFQALDGAGGKRIATIAYLIPTDADGGEYTVKLASKQQGKGRLSAYNESLARSLENIVLEHLEYDLLSSGWRKSITGTWFSPAVAWGIAPDQLEPLPENLTQPALPDTVKAATRIMGEPEYEALHDLVRASQDLTPNAVMLVSLPKDVYVVLMHGKKFADLMQMIAKTTPDKD